MSAPPSPRASSAVGFSDFGRASSRTRVASAIVAELDERRGVAGLVLLFGGVSREDQLCRRRLI